MVWMNKSQRLSAICGRHFITSRRDAETQRGCLEHTTDLRSSLSVRPDVIGLPAGGMGSTFECTHAPRPRMRPIERGRRGRGRTDSFEEKVLPAPLRPSQAGKPYISVKLKKSVTKVLKNIRVSRVINPSAPLRLCGRAEFLFNFYNNILTK